MNQFRLTLCLRNYFDDHRSMSRIYVNEDIKTIGNLEDHIARVFGISSPMDLSSNYYYLPSSEDVRILEKDEIVIVNSRKHHNCDQQYDENEEKNAKKRRRCGHYTDITKKDRTVKEKVKSVDLLEEHNEESFTESLETLGNDLKEPPPKVKKEKKKKKKEILSMDDEQLVLEDEHKHPVIEEEASNVANQIVLVEEVMIHKEPSLKTKNVNIKVANSTNPECDLKLEEDAMSVDEADNMARSKTESINGPKVIITEHYILNKSCTPTNRSSDEETVINNGFGEYNNESEAKCNLNGIEPITEKKDKCDKSGKIRPPANRNRMKLFSVSETLQLLQAKASNGNESTADNVSIESDTSSRRKRTRKHKKKKKDEESRCSSVNSSEATTVKVPSPIGTPALHIRFDSDEERKTENEEKVEATIESFHINGIQNSQNDESLDSPLSDNVIKKFPKIASHIPKEYDVIAFKVLKMTEDYTPTISQYVAGKVLKFDPKDDMIHFKILYGKEELREPIGKFSLEEDVEEDDGIKCFKWSNLKEIRLLFP